MANACGILSQGQDNACLTDISRKYEQRAVLINWDDLSNVEIQVPTSVSTECNYNVEFSLKEGKTGYAFTASEAGTSIKGFYDKSSDDLGNVQYNHQVQMLIMNILESSKCILHSLDRGKFVVALRNGDNIEIYGIKKGLTTADYTFDTTDGGGGALINLTSQDANQETLLPLIYKSAVPGSEIEDFMENFANETPSV